VPQQIADYCEAIYIVKIAVVLLKGFFIIYFNFVILQQESSAWVSYSYSPAPAGAAEFSPG
jgi:hypothetical protein